MEIHKLLTPYNHVKSTIDRIRFIVIHYVGATGGAKANCQYYAECNRNASAHYFVDFDGSIWQSVEDQDVAWSVGGKKYQNTNGGSFHGICTNTNSLNIEMCVRKTGNKWYFELETEKSTLDLVRMLMKKYNIPVDKVIRHYDVTGKICPEPYVRDTKQWTSFLNSLSEHELSIGWIYDTDENKYWYRFGNGDCPRNDWYKAYCESDGKEHWFLFDENGWMLTGQQRFNDKNYYLEEFGDLMGACMVTNERGELSYLQGMIL